MLPVEFVAVNLSQLPPVTFDNLDVSVVPARVKKVQADVVLLTICDKLQQQNAELQQQNAQL